MKNLALILMTTGLFLVSGCGGYSAPNNSNTSQGAPTLTGNWQFTFTSSKGASTVSGTLTQTGSNFTGAMTIANSCATSATFSGTLTGTSFTGTSLVEGNLETITVTGNVASSYGSANGTFQVMSATGVCAGDSGISGTWTGTHTTVSGGPYGGMVQVADRIPVQLTLNLNEGAGGQVSGTAAFLHSACFHSVSVAGTLSGTNLQLQGDNGTNGSIVLSGTTDAEGRTLTMNSTVSGACQAESGAGTLTKMQ